MYDFGKYIKENKAVLIGLLAATSINAISQLSVIKDMDFGALLSSQTQYETVINQQSAPMPTEIVVKSDHQFWFVSKSDSRTCKLSQSISLDDAHTASHVQFD